MDCLVEDMCIDKKKRREYFMWKNMLSRCTDKYWGSKPTYLGTNCSNNFKSYAFFYEWCNKQIGFGSVDENNRYWHLDKDLLIKGNKLYSEDTCVFIPSRINNLFVKRENLRGENPIGVYWSKNPCKFVARCNINKGVQKHLGNFETPEQAFLAYKTFKESLIKQVANEYKSQLDPRAYEALINYTVEITD